MRLIYISPLPWLSFAQRPHKFVTWFHNRTAGEVLWVDPYPTRLPAFSDIRRLFGTPDRKSESYPSWLSVIRPSFLPIEPMPGSGLLNSLLWQSMLHKVDVFALSQNCLLVIGKPSVLALTVLERLKGLKSVYDAMDDFPAFYTGLSRLAMGWREDQLVRSVDIVLASSTAIHRRWSQIGADVKLVHNGLDSEAIPDFVGLSANKSKKIFGYIGTIAKWFDWDWVIELARRRPDDVVRLIGPLFSMAPAVLPNNIEIHPACSHKSAMIEMQGFDVGLIPFKINKLTASVDPIKYYEYRALGLPVISTGFGEMAFRGDEDGTFLSQGVHDISDLVALALSHNTTLELVQQFKEANTWDSRFGEAKVI